MHTRTHNPFTTIHTEGTILPADLLQRVLAVDPSLEGLSPADYHLPNGEKLNEAINRSWNRLQGSWATFRTSRGRLSEGDARTTLTRERWLLPLFQELGYGRLQTAKAVELDGKSYPISHKWGDTPFHLVGCGIKLDKRTAGTVGASRASPHSLLQELLNRLPELLWGLVSNGLHLRVLRDNASLTRQAFLEFDLESMFEGEVYSDFAVLWLVCHQSRFESGDSRVESCWLEKWSKVAQERGTRALDQLRNGVEEAIKALGSGFLAQPANRSLRQKLRSGELNALDYYRQLLRLVYRLIFLFAAEDRDLLLDPQTDITARDRYLRYYSTARLRRLAERQRGGRHADLWQGLLVVTDILGGKTTSRQDAKDAKKINQENFADFAPLHERLGLTILNGFLFSDKALPDLEASQVDNQSLLNAIRSLAFTIEGSSRRAVDYKNLGPEELGSVYESLLELHPLLNTDAGAFDLASAAGNERKTTGSYYTPTSLIQVLLDSALDPVIEQALEEASRKAAKDAKDFEKEKSALLASLREQALLNLKVCDPACGSGHFLIAAAHRIAGKLAQVRAGGDEPSPEETRRALRDIIRNCIYGVDINPMAVELCKVNLWLESIEPGKPLSFLDAHIQCGDSLVGVSPNLDISEIPDEAFNPAFGDDKATVSALKKRNKRERTGQMGMHFEVTHLLTNMDDLARWLAERAEQVDAMPEDDSTQVQAKAKAFDDYHATHEYLKNRFELDLWTAAFFWKIPKADAESMLAPTQQELIQLRSGGEPALSEVEGLDSRLVERVKELSGRLNFFHWELAFPKVFAGENAGFDCVLGNPPWETLQLDEQEYFAARDPEIAALPGESRKKAIAEMVKTNVSLADAFIEAKHLSESQSKFLKNSGRYILSATGKMNTYALFAEHFRQLMSSTGFSGIIVPTGIATDDSTKQFFGDLVEKLSVVSLFDFENREGLFPGVHRSYKFSLFTISNIPAAKSEFVFFATKVEQLRETYRRFSLAPKEIALFNPNTRTMPVFRTKYDAEISQSIYRKFPVLESEYKKKNPWGIWFRQGLFNMTTDSGLFATSPRDGLVPLYEAKLIWHFDHRWATFDGDDTRDLTIIEKGNPSFYVTPRYWVPVFEVDAQLDGWDRDWFLGFRDVTNATNERTAIFSIIPKIGVGHTLPLMFTNEETIKISCLLGNLNSFVFDYIARQKVGGIHLTFMYLKQLPVLPPSAYTSADIEYIAPRVLELVYTAYDLCPFAEDMGYHGEPFRWDEVRRAQLRAELDAYYARLYGLTRDELRYILDPKEVHGEDFPGETFRVLKEKEMRRYGEYRTRRLVLEAWDALEGNQVMGYTGKQVAELPMMSYQSSESIAWVKEEKQEEINAQFATPKSGEENPAQTMLSDFGLYKCGECGKMVMGFEKENHIREAHEGKWIEWKKLK